MLPIRQAALAAAFFLHIINVLAFADPTGQPSSVASIADCPDGFAKVSASEIWTTCSNAADKTPTKRASGDDTDVAAKLKKLPGVLNKINSKAKEPSTSQFVVSSNLIQTQKTTLQSMHRAFVALKTKGKETKPTWDKRLVPFTKNGNSLQAKYEAAFRITSFEARTVSAVIATKSVPTAAVSARLRTALEKIPSYNGLAILQTRLTDELIRRIVRPANQGHGLMLNILLNVDELAMNIKSSSTFKSKLTRQDIVPREFNVMLATPGLTRIGIGPPPDIYEQRMLYTIVIKSHTGKYVTPFMMANRPSLAWTQGHFRVLGFTKRNKVDTRDTDPEVIYVEETTM